MERRKIRDPPQSSSLIYQCALDAILVSLSDRSGVVGQVVEPLGETGEIFIRATFSMPAIRIRFLNHAQG